MDLMGKWIITFSQIQLTWHSYTVHGYSLDGLLQSFSCGIYEISIFFLFLKQFSVTVKDNLRCNEIHLWSPCFAQRTHNLLLYFVLYHASSSDHSMCNLWFKARGI